MKHAFQGRCPVCEQAATFQSESDWFRDCLLCSICGSIPRERAFAWALDHFAPSWPQQVVHECSPAARKVSERMQDRCPGYIGTHYFPGVTPGALHDGFQCENLEAMTFADSSIDVHAHLDVLEHVNHPEHCFAEMERTLRPGGVMVFTTPVYDGKRTTERRGYYDDAGQIHFLGEPEYHGNPIDAKGAPVTFHFGSDLSQLILMWTRNCGVLQLTPNDPAIGVVGEFREVFVVTKRN